MRNRNHFWRRLRLIAAAVLLLTGVLSGCAVRAGEDSPWKFFTGGTEFDNNFSLITTVTHGKMRLVFAGDIEKQRIRAYLETGAAQKCDFLKVPHHGVYNTALPELFETLRPEYVVICSSKKNPADVETVEALKRCGAEVLETRSGDITVVSDGARLSMRQS